MVARTMSIISVVGMDGDGIEGDGRDQALCCNCCWWLICCNCECGCECECGWCCFGCDCDCDCGCCCDCRRVMCMVSLLITTRFPTNRGHDVITWGRRKSVAENMDMSTLTASRHIIQPTSFLCAATHSVVWCLNEQHMVHACVALVLYVEVLCMLAWKCLHDCFPCPVMKQ